MTANAPAPGSTLPQHHDAGPDIWRADMIDGDSVPDCQTCGACCSYSADWPRFTTETDQELDMVPLEFVAADQQGMRCDGERCSALSGKVGESTSCLIYAARPDVCRACSPGDYACATARAAFRLG